MSNSFAMIAKEVDNSTVAHKFIKYAVIYVVIFLRDE
mgnify:CR=1 FL=1